MHYPSSRDTVNGNCLTKPHEIALIASICNCAYCPSRYEEIAEETFGKLGRLIISSIIYVELFGTCCLLFILEVGHT